jgi:hypothetical protein
VDFLEGHTKKITKDELDGLEALYKVGIDLSKGLSSSPAIALPSLLCQQFSSPQLLEFLALLQTPAPFFENGEDIP